MQCVMNRLTATITIFVFMLAAFATGAGCRNRAVGIPMTGGSGSSLGDGGCDGAFGSHAGNDDGGGPSSDSRTGKVVGTDLKYDVVVVGAGTGGVAAAIQAARLGAKVALLEETDWIGGQATAAGVGSMDERGWTGPVGLYGEFRNRIVTHYAALGKATDTCYWNASTLCFEPVVGKAVLEHMLLAEPGIDLFLAIRPIAVETSDAARRPTIVAVDAKQTTASTVRHYRIAAPVFVDASEYGDLIALTPAMVRLGNTQTPSLDETACVQDMTYTMVIRRYRAGVPDELQIRQAPPGYDESVKNTFASVVARGGHDWLDASGHYADYGSYPVSFQTLVGYRAMPDSSTPGTYTSCRPTQISKTSLNWPNHVHVSVSDITDQDARRRAICEAKLRTIQFLYYIQNVLGQHDWSVANDQQYDTTFNRQQTCPQIPENLKAIERQMPMMAYTREARRMVGLYTLTSSDINRQEPFEGGPPRSVTNFSTSLATGDSAIDLHGCRSMSDIESSLETWADISNRNRAGLFQIPFGAFIPEFVDGLIAAEKNLSVSRLVNGAIRQLPVTMLTGQAAGAIAALAALRGIQPRDVPPILIQSVLARSGSRLSRYRFDDVPPRSPSWWAVQLATTYDLMKGRGDGIPADGQTNSSAATDRFGVGQALTREQAAALLCRLGGLDRDNPPDVPSFEDVPLWRWSYGFVEAAHAAGLITGCGQGRFCPESQVSRADAAVLILTGFGIQPNSDTTPDADRPVDVPESDPRLAWIQKALALHMMTPCEGQEGGSIPIRYCPDDPILRQDTAAALAEGLLRSRTTSAADSR